MANLIFYKGTAPGATLWDKLICIVTKSKYSHVELSFEQRGFSHRCWSSSTRDGGIRTKWITADTDSWDLVPLSCTVSERWFELHEGFKYDYIGLIGTIIHSSIFSNKYRWFCSECIAEVLGLKDSWKYSPEDLYQIYK